MIHETWLLVLLTVLAVARLTRLVTEDKITQPARSWLIAHTMPPMQRDDDEHWLVQLVHCRWCASIWIGLPAATAVYFWHGQAAVQILLLGLAASHAAVLLAALEDD